MAQCMTRWMRCARWIGLRNPSVKPLIDTVAFVNAALAKGGVLTMLLASVSVSAQANQGRACGTAPDLSQVSSSALALPTG